MNDEKSIREIAPRVNALHDHARAIKSAWELANDETYPESTRRGARAWLNHLLNHYSFIDNKMPGGGFAIRVVRKGDE